MENSEPRRTWRRWIVPVVAMLFMCGLMYACAVAAGFSVIPHPPPALRIIGMNCGQAIGNSDPDQAGQCLWDAYQTCQTATLVDQIYGVEGGDTTQAITIQQHGGSCAVTEVVQSYQGPNGHTSVSTYHCAGLQQLTGGELVLKSCGAAGDDEGLFPQFPGQLGQICGLIQTADGTVSSGTRQANGQVPVADIEGCFSQAYARCSQPATLIYQIYLSTGVTTHLLRVNVGQGSCEITDDVGGQAYGCAGLAQLPAGGLVVQGCTAEGDVTLPKATPGYQ